MNLARLHLAEHQQQIGQLNGQVSHNDLTIGRQVDFRLSAE